MQLQKQHNTGLQFSSLLQAPRAGAGATLHHKIAENPALFTADVLDLGAGVSTALGVTGAGAGQLQGTPVAVSAYHGAKAVYHLISGANESDNGITSEGKHHFTMALGEALSATGQICIASGVGPVALGFLGLGMLITNSAQLNH